MGITKIQWFYLINACLICDLDIAMKCQISEVQITEAVLYT